MSEKNIKWQSSMVSHDGRERLNGHRGGVIWLTGLSGAGKSTLAYALEKTLYAQGRRTLVLDGDNIRHGLCSDLGFSSTDRRENLRRVAEVAKLTMEAGIVTLAAFISPMREDRKMIKEIIGEKQFLEIFVSCPVEICEVRDVKGLYRRARAGEIKEFTGVSAPYEVPVCADLVLNTGEATIDDCVLQVLKKLNTVINLN
jgi:adenylylsulfate kinase